MSGDEVLGAILVPHPTRPAVLTTANGALPTVTSTEWSTTELLAAVAARLGSLPPVLRIVTGPIDRDGDSNLRLVELDTIGPDAPPGLTWTDSADLDPPIRHRSSFVTPSFGRSSAADDANRVHWIRRGRAPAGSRGPVPG